ncbi:MAG: hypothetical protein OXC44_04915 [Proteobacteria bacterium]|nr:hypothetical protein [Pseudomonadota bacterium]
MFVNLLTVKCDGIYEHFQRHAEEAASISFHPNDFLKLVLGRTKEHYPKNPKATTLLSRAKFRSCVHDWDSSFNRKLNRSALRGLMLSGFIE